MIDIQAGELDENHLDNCHEPVEFQKSDKVLIDHML